MIIDPLTKKFLPKYSLSLLKISMLLLGIMIEYFIYFLDNFYSKLIYDMLLITYSICLHVYLYYNNIKMYHLIHYVRPIINF